MKIKKVNNTFNDYSVELSWGQLNAIFAALEKDHADPLADELFAELGWYLENVPGPGEDEDAYKEAKEAEKQAVEGGDEIGGEGSRDMEGVGQEIGGPGAGEDLEGAGPPAEGVGGDEEPGGEPKPPRKPGGPGAGGGPEGPEADDLLERPPSRPPAE